MRNIRTPSSLKWLIDKKARIDGEIKLLEMILPDRVQRTKRDLDAVSLRYAALKKCDEQNFQLLKERLPKLRQQLAAIKMALGLHEVSVDPQSIPPIRPQSGKRLAPYGAMTRDIYLFLTIVDAPATTKEIAEFLYTRYQIFEAEISFMQWRTRIRYRLKNLAKQEKILRLHDLGDTRGGIWAIPPHKSN